MTSYAEAVRALLRAGFSNRDIIDLTKADGRDEVKRLGELALADEAETALLEEGDPNEE